MRSADSRRKSERSSLERLRLLQLKLYLKGKQEKGYKFYVLYDKISLGYILELNPIIRGWMNYYKIDKVSYTQVAFKKLDDYLRVQLNRYYNRKSQRKSDLHGQQAYDLLTRTHGLIAPCQTSGIRPVNAVRRK